MVLFLNPSSYSSTSTIPSSCHASFFLSFPIFTILLLFMLSFYISFLLALLTFSSHFSSNFSFFTDDYSLVLVLNILSLLSCHSSTCSVNLVLLRVSHPTAVLLSPFGQKYVLLTLCLTLYCIVHTTTTVIYVRFHVFYAYTLLHFSQNLYLFKCR